MVKQFNTTSNGDNQIPDNINSNGASYSLAGRTADPYSVMDVATGPPAIVLPDQGTLPSSPRAGSTRQRQSSSLRTQLLMAILPGVLVPLGIASVCSSIIASRSAEQQAEQFLETRTQLASDVSRQLLSDAAKIPGVVATNPLVIDAARSAAKAAEASGLPTRSIDQAEQAFSATKVLKINQALNDYLKRTTETGKFAEIFFTDKHGFNVAYSHPTSDFVQRDEAWWQRGKTEDKQVALPKHDE